MTARRTDKNLKERDPDLTNAEAALKRAVRNVRDRAAKAGIPLVFVKDGKIVEEVPGKSSVSR